MKVTGFVIALAASVSAIPFKMADYTTARAVEVPEIRTPPSNISARSFPSYGPGNLTARGYGGHNETGLPPHVKPTVIDKRAFTPEGRSDQKGAYHNGIVYRGPKNQTYHA